MDECARLDNKIFALSGRVAARAAGWASKQFSRQIAIHSAQKIPCLHRSGARDCGPIRRGKRFPTLSSPTWEHRLVNPGPKAW